MEKVSLERLSPAQQQKRLRLQNKESQIFSSLLKILATAGEGLSIKEIEARARFERHTLSKYLSIMQQQGLLVHRVVGKAKLWSLNAAPLVTILSANKESKTYLERILSNILSTLPMGLVVVSDTFMIQYCNDIFAKQFNTNMGSSFMECLGFNQRSQLQSLNSVFDSLAVALPQKHVLQTHFGHTLSCTASILENPDKTRSVLLVVEDITDSLRNTKLIEEQKSLLQAEREALNSAAIVAETDLRGNITYVNDQFVKISGYSESELLGQNHRILNSKFHPKSFFADMWKKISSGKVWRGVIRNKRKNGDFYWVDSVIAPVLGNNGKPIKYISIRFDITKYVGTTNVLQKKKN
ncbi:MAG TPA: PAS domain S-box protein [Acidobacteriota bacterium]|nr:PAS domain S-box protein [Acidobacteriota bacterium]